MPTERSETRKKCVLRINNQTVSSIDMANVKMAESNDKNTHTHSPNPHTKGEILKKRQQRETRNPRK